MWNTLKTTALLFVIATLLASLSATARAVPQSLYSSNTVISTEAFPSAGGRKREVERPCVSFHSRLLRSCSSVTTYKGKFPDGAKYLIQVPSNWNGTLVLYSHGYVIPGFSNPAEDVGDPITGSYLLANGYALGGSS